MKQESNEKQSKTLAADKEPTKAELERQMPSAPRSNICSVLTSPTF